MKNLLLVAAAMIGLLISTAVVQAGGGEKFLAPAPAPTGGPCAFFGGFYVGAHAGTNLHRADRNDDDGYLTDNAAQARTDEAFLGGV